MSKIKLIFGTSNAVPSGETEALFENTYQKAFKPFLTLIYNHPEMHPTLFYAGPLLEWLEKKHPEFHTVLGEMMSRKNIEILGGGYWSPMLPLVPSPDRVGQIEVMTTYLRKKFGKRSRGSWITSQVWEAHLASSLRASGMDYVFLSERAFPVVPSFRADVPVIAEDQGKTVVIFPVMDSLTERFLKVPPEDILESLKRLEPSEEQEVVVSLIINGRSLGDKGNHKVCYEEKWLENFFNAVSRSRDWLECVHPGKYIRSVQFPRKKMYVPGPTYDSLMRWSRVENLDKVDTDHSRPGPFYRDFLTKYRESGLLYAKMMHIEVLTNQLRGDKYRKKTAKEELWKGQEHYAYWHGPTGGIYSSRIRHAAYAALLEAEKATRERGIFKAGLSSVDFDMDGEREFLYNGLNFNAYVHTEGGALFELDYLPVSRNYLSTFSHYPEDYHPPAIQKQGYDKYPRHAFLDHILRPEDGPESFEHGSCRSQSIFPGKRYEVLEFVRDQSRVTLRSRGPINSNGEILEITKTYRFRRNNLEVDYLLANPASRTLGFQWGTEINLALSDNAEMRSISINGAELKEQASDGHQTYENVESFTILDAERDVMMHLTLSVSGKMCSFPIYADYRVGKELCHKYQSSFFMPCWHVELPPMGTHSCKINLRIGRYKKR